MVRRDHRRRRAASPRVEVDGVTHINVASVEHGTYEVRSTPDGDYVVDESGDPPGGDDVVLPERPGKAESHDHGTQPRAPRDTAGAAGAPGPWPSADAPDTIDIAIVYPARWSRRWGSPAMEAQFALGITQTNEALRQRRRRHPGAAGGHAPGRCDAVLRPWYTNLRALGTPGDGIFDEAQALREETHADLVSLWLSGSVPARRRRAASGTLGGTDPQYDAEYAAWSVVSRPQVRHEHPRVRPRDRAQPQRRPRRGAS